MCNLQQYPNISKTDNVRGPDAVSETKHSINSPADKQGGGGNQDFGPAMLKSNKKVRANRPHVSSPTCQSKNVFFAHFSRLVLGVTISLQRYIIPALHGDEKMRVTFYLPCHGHGHGHGEKIWLGSLGFILWCAYLVLNAHRYSRQSHGVVVSALPSDRVLQSWCAK